MKLLNVKPQEDIVALSLSILLWCISLVGIYVFAEICFTEENAPAFSDESRVVRYYEKQHP